MLIAQTAEHAARPGLWYTVPILLFAVGMLIWDTVEVGRNDAANLINAVYGARLMPRRRAVLIAGIATIIGAMFAGGVMETARKGIFDPSLLNIENAIIIYVSVYLVDTVLLYGYSAYGMPVSTTACLVFELLGGAIAIAIIRDKTGIVQWTEASKVVSAIVMSIFLSGFASYLIQRIVRGAIGARTDDLRTMRLHGVWIGGGLTTGLVFFLLLKGMKNASIVQSIHKLIRDLDLWIKQGLPRDTLIEFNLGLILVLFLLWLGFGLAIALLLRVFKERAASRIFPAIAILGMIAMGIAFGQNDLANCASPGLATVNLIQNWEMGSVLASEVPIKWWMLLGCGVLLFVGMRTKNAARVTKAGVAMGSHVDRVSLYAPGWCLAIGERLTRQRQPDISLAPMPEETPKGKVLHYDALRASTIMGVAASVIALASSYKFPVSTTYVTFAAVVGSGMGDKIFARGDAGLKIARSIWVVTSWFLAALIAAVFTFFVATVVYFLGVPGMFIMLAVNLYMRRIFKRRGDAQAERSRQEMLERAYPEQYASEYE